MISKIGSSTPSPTLFPLYLHYKLSPVSTSTYLYPLHIAIHPPNSFNSIASSSPLIGPHNAKQSAFCPPPPHFYTACRSSPPSPVQSINLFLLSAPLFLPSVCQHSPDPLTPNIYTFCLALALHHLPTTFSLECCSA